MDVEIRGLASGERALLDGAADMSRAFLALAGMPDGRLQNVEAAMNAIHGTAIAPFSEFSFLEALGEVSAAGGYAMSHMDADGSSPNGLGGGVSEVASVLFRAAVWAGLPFTERHAHPYRLGWIEPPVGLDATVAPGGRDLRFINDSQSYLLLRARRHPASEALQVEIWAAPLFQRSVRLDGPTVTRLTPAGGTRQAASEFLAQGERIQRSWAREGAIVSLLRTVSIDGREHLRDPFESRYAPAFDETVVGTGAP